MQAEYAAWLEAMPEATHDSPTGQALQAIVELDLDEIVAIEPPRGFGRDERLRPGRGVLAASLAASVLPGV